MDVLLVGPRPMRQQLFRSMGKRRVSCVMQECGETHQLSIPALANAIRVICKV